jgi:hypothetical protein
MTSRIFLVEYAWKMFILRHYRTVIDTSLSVGCLTKPAQVELSFRPKPGLLQGFRSFFNPRSIYVTSSVLGQGVFDSPSLTLVISAKSFLTNSKYF